MKIDDLVSRLATEMFQAEESAKEHPRKEAERLAGTPPGAAMLAISNHAERAFPELARIAKELELARPGIGAAFGTALSLVREAVIDRVVSQEKSYRATLSGMQHGVDLFFFAAAAALNGHQESLATFCEQWLAERRPLVEAVREQLTWFADNPERA